MTEYVAWETKVYSEVEGENEPTYYWFIGFLNVVKSVETTWSKNPEKVRKVSTEHSNNFALWTYQNGKVAVEATRRQILLRDNPEHF